MITVEAIGLPGSGKSTVFKEGAKKMHREGVFLTEELLLWVTTLSRVQRVPFWLKAALLTIRHLQVARTFGAVSVFRLFTLVSYKKGFIDRFTPKVLLLDQWFYQGVWSVLAYPKKRKAAEVEKLFAPLPTPDLVIHFVIDPSQASKRIATRTHGKSRFEGDNESAVLERLQGTEQLTDHIAKTVKQRGIRLLELDATAPVETNAEKICAAIRELV